MSRVHSFFILPFLLALMLSAGCSLALGIAGRDPCADG